MIDSNNDIDPRRAIEHFYFAYRAFTAGPDRLLEARGLGRVHHRILYFVGRNPGLSVGMLLDILKVSKQAINAPLRKLVEDGLIAIEKPASDRRMRCLSLTDEGMALEAHLTAIQTELLARAFSRAGPGAASGWFAVMAQLPESG